ncbi:hypothetical protein GCM10010156_51010 [Planobispora rosea]|uniref:Uncharacterized protein n=1 Tax=Planobispora rosea TaxID=35762 RepID=A0A8J3S983_PLARO|nr:hypothetical protein GCM10010156_51010 [Planobispora rosea]GIH89025.1 hypothetical protein Pro02_74330 [Planobispora rosea]
MGMNGTARVNGDNSIDTLPPSGGPRPERRAHVEHVERAERRRSRRGSPRAAIRPVHSRTPCYEAPHRLPAVPTRTWFRVCCLLWRRGEVADPCARRMARHLAYHADESGKITDMPRVMRAYAAYHGLSTRTGWKDLGRVMDVGWVRRVHGAAPGRPALYQLCLDIAGLPCNLPKNLVRAVTDVVDAPPGRVPGPRTRAPGAEPGLGRLHAALAQCVVVQYGGALSPEKIVRTGSGRVHTSPFFREGPTPPPQRPVRRGGRDPLQPSPWWDKNGYNDIQQAREVLARCLPRWRAQRTGLVPSGTEVPDATALASLEHLVRLLLRYVPSGEAVDLLTEQVASARNVTGVVRYRIGSWLRSFRRRANLPVDEDGVGYRRMQEELAARRARSTPEGRQAAKDIARRVRDRKAAGDDVGRHLLAERKAAETLRRAQEAEQRRREHVELLRAQEMQAGQRALEETLREAAAREESRRRAVERARHERHERRERVPYGEPGTAAPARDEGLSHPGPSHDRSSCDESSPGRPPRDRGRSSLEDLRERLRRRLEGGPAVPPQRERPIEAPAAEPGEATGAGARTL